MLSICTSCLLLFLSPVPSIRGVPYPLYFSLNLYSVLPCTSSSCATLFFYISFLCMYVLLCMSERRLDMLPGYLTTELCSLRSKEGTYVPLHHHYSNLFLRLTLTSFLHSWNSHYNPTFLLLYTRTYSCYPHRPLGVLSGVGDGRWRQHYRR